MGKPFPIDQGLNFGDPSDDIRDGELRLARNCFYEPESTELRKIWGRSIFGTVNPGSAITGIGFVSFRQQGNFLLATAGTSLAQARVGDTGSFTSLKTLPKSAGRSEFLYYNGTDRAYIMDGVNRGQVWDGQAAATRDMGLDRPPNDLQTTVLQNSQTNYSAGSTYQYVYTEYDSVNDIESSSSEVVIVAIITNSDTIKLAIQAKHSSGTNKFRIYKTQAGGEVFFRLAEIDAQSVESFYYDGVNTDSGTPAAENSDPLIWGFKSVEDIFLSRQPVLDMIGQPIRGNYVTVNGTPPIGDMFILFENSLCVGGVPGFPQDMYFSQADNPEQFSPVNFVKFENPRGDPLTGMGVANDRFIGFCLNSIYRLDTLPRVTDPGFGLATASRQLVTDDHGCVAKRTVVNYGIGQPNNRLFYLSTRGPMATDGYTAVPLNADMNWDKKYVNFSQIDKSFALNFPKYAVIILMVPSVSSTDPDMAFIYHYHPAHMKKSTGVGKWTGPIHIRAIHGASVYERNTETRIFTADSNTSSTVYLEDQGSTDASNYEDSSGSINWEWETGDQRVGSEGNMKRFRRAFVSFDGTSADLPDLESAVSKRDLTYRTKLNNITRAAKRQIQLGTSLSVEEPKTVTGRAGIWRAGTHLRLRMQEIVPNVDRGISSIEVEIEPWGSQRG